MKIFNFLSKQQYTNYLNALFLPLLADYNIMIHQIFLLDRDSREFGEYNTCEHIVKTGLKIDKYASIFGTLTKLENTQNIAKDIIDYCYSVNQTGDVYSLIFAIPKNITINNKTLNFSGMEYISDEDFSKLMCVQSKDSHRIMHNVLDMTKGFCNLPQSFCIGWQKINQKENLFELHECNKNFVNAPQEAKDAVLLPYKQKFIEKTKKYNTTDFAKLLYKSTEEYDIIQEQLNDYEI